jgi:hypothetical protein
MSGDHGWTSSTPVRTQPADDQAWKTHGLCRDDRAPFELVEPVGVVAAKRVCASCAVRSACFESAIKRGETSGVWGAVKFRSSTVRDERRRRGGV